MKTLGGYKITEFKKLSKTDSEYENILINNYTFLKPQIYSGVVDDPKCGTNLVLWNEDGKCSNYSREDCFIDVSKLKL